MTALEFTLSMLNTITNISMLLLEIYIIFRHPQHKSKID